MKFILAFYLLLGTFTISAQSISCHKCTSKTELKCPSCIINGNSFTGLIYKRPNRADLPLHSPLKITNKNKWFRIEDLYGTKVEIDISTLGSTLNTINKFYDFVGSCFCTSDEASFNVFDSEVDGVENTIYLDTSNAKLYLWNGSEYVTNSTNTTATDGLRISSGNVVMASDSPTDAKGSQYISNKYNHLNSFSNSWIGSGGQYSPVIKLQNNSIVRLNSDNDDQDNGDKFKLKFDPINKSIYIGSHTYDTNTYNSLQSLVLGYDTKSHGNYNVVIGRSVGITGSGSFNIGRGTQITNSGSPTDNAENINLGAFNSIINAYRVGLFGNASTINNGLTSYYISHNSNVFSPNECQGFISSSQSSSDNKFFSFGYNLQTSGNLNSGVFGSNHNLINTSRVYMFGTSNYSNGNVEGGFIGRMMHQSGAFQFGLGFNNVSFTGQNASLIVDNDLLFSIGNGKDISYNPGLIYSGNETFITKSNALTIFKNGSTQINNIPSTTSLSKTQNDVTPMAALEVVSTNKGFLPPRLSETQSEDWIESFNNTTDVTGLSGTGDEKHSRQGEMIYCIDCEAIDASIGVTLVAQWNGLSWVAKKLW